MAFIDNKKEVSPEGEYFASIRKFPLLTAEQEKEYAIAYKKYGDQSAK